MTINEEIDGYDPLVAEQFELLNLVSPPDVAPVFGQANHKASGRLEQPIDITSRQDVSSGATSKPLYLLAAAAAMITVAGASVFALASISNDASLQAGDGDGQTEIVGEEPQVTDSDSSDGKSLTVEVPESTADAADQVASQDTSTTAATNSDQGVDDGDGPATGQGTVAEAESPNPDGSNEAGTAPASTTTTTSVVSSTTTAPPETTPPTTAVDPAETTELTSDRSWLDPPTAEKMISIRGTVTEVFTDCQSRLILNDSGEVESVGPISCDGGSYIVVDNTRVMTASGFLMNEADMYGKHIAALRPGQQVTVTAVPTASAGGMLTLNCVLCEIKLGS